MTIQSRQPDTRYSGRRTMPKRPGETHYNSAFLEYRGANLPVEDIPDQSVNPDMLRELSMDLTSRTQLPPKLTDEALVQTAENYLKQCSADGSAVTYEGMLLQHIVPELVERLKDKDDTTEKTDR